MSNIPELTISLPQELYDKMKRYKEVQWSNVAKEVFAKKISDLERVE